VYENPGVGATAPLLPIADAHVLRPQIPVCLWRLGALFSDFQVITPVTCSNDFKITNYFLILE